jgi:hypothetical protein
MRHRPTQRLSPALRQFLRPVPTYLTREESCKLGEVVLKMKVEGTWPPPDEGEPPPGAPRSPHHRGSRSRR